MPSEAAAQFNIHDAKTNLSRIIDRVEHGEEIVISRAGNPVAKVVPLVAAADWDSDEVNEVIAREFGMMQ
jgi:prevent-host-death family protein